MVSKWYTYWGQVKVEIMKNNFGAGFLVGLGFVLGVTIMVTILFITCVFLFGDRSDSFGSDVNFENQTDWRLTIIYRGNDDEYWYKAGDIAPNETRKMEMTLTLNFVIKALDTSGKVVYSKEFTDEELMELDYTVVIPPLDVTCLL